ncbi:MAG: hypothetical protein ABIH23_33530 [bacterium]
MNSLLASFFSIVLVSQAGTETETPVPVMLQETTSAGSAVVSPDHGISGEFGTWTVTYTIGQPGILEGGGIRVQLPDDWHSGPRNSANRLQATDPADDHYVTAACSREDTKLECIVESQTDSRLVKHAKESLDGRLERYVFVVRVRLLGGKLDSGDTLSVTYGDRSGGSRGHCAAAVSTKPLPILIAVDEDGTNRFKLHTGPPTIQALPGKPVEMLFHAPSCAVVDQPITLLVTLMDKESNPAIRPSVVRISRIAGKAGFPVEVEIPENRSYVQFEVIPRSADILRLKAESNELDLWANANPVDVTTAPTERQIYWGDTHSHTRFSWDGVGDDQFNYARSAMGLDFYAMTDHSMLPKDGLTRGLCEKYYDEYFALVDEYNDPNHFVTIPAYECSFGKPYGHHNVYFRDKPGPLMYPSSTTLAGLWASLKAGHALTIPHHTGKFPSGIDFSYNDSNFRRNFEIYSGHGLSEVYNPEHPLAFEFSLFTSDSKSLKEPTHAQDVWKAGLRFSTISSSDDHRAQPGQPHYGITALRAPELTRYEIFRALYDRHTYGTTGSKIILDFSLNDTPMGQFVTVESSPDLKVRVVGTDIIERVEILRYQPSQESFCVIKAWRPDSLEFTDQFTDRNYEPGAIYYTRVKQKNLVRDRIVMAWSSPIWTEAAK